MNSRKNEKEVKEKEEEGERRRGEEIGQRRGGRFVVLCFGERG